MLKRINIFRGVALLSAALLTASIFGALLLEEYRPMVDEALGTKSVEWVSEGEVTYDDFKIDYANSDELIEAHKEHAIKVQEEGSVLLKNINEALPIEQTSKITLLGMGSHKAVYGGQLGSDVLESQTITIEDALERKGFTLNPVMREIYASLEETNSPGRLGMAMSMGTDYKQYSTKQPSLEQIYTIDPDYRESFIEYSDAAIVVFTRPGSEAGDYFPGEFGKNSAEGGSENALGLDANERAILELAKENFDKVIVLINAINQMEIDELKQDNEVDAILWIGFMGNYGSLGLANLLCGEDDDGDFVSPSGALTNSYAVNSASAPATQNFGFYKWKNWESFETSPKAQTYSANEYLVEAEGIYVGYRYYETRYYDSIVRPQSNATSEAGDFVGDDGAWHYSDEVSYSFGYGLSYTTFDYALDKVDVASNKKTATISGSITNTGVAASKTPIQIYVQVPYVEGGLEKSAIQLVDYEKSPLINPGDTYEFEMELDLSYIATYDSSNGGCYIMDGGDYYFAIGNGAHDALNNILAMQGKTESDGMDYAGNKDAVVVCSPYGEQGDVDRETFSTSKAGVEIKNQLEQADLNYYMPGTVTYLSRRDWNTFPKTYGDMTIDATEEMISLLKNDTYEFTVDEEKAAEINYAVGEENGLSIMQMKGASYDDERWDDLLAQIDMEELLDTTARAQDIIRGMESIGLPDLRVSGDALGIKRTLYDEQFTDKNNPWWGGKDPGEDKNAEFRCRDTYPLIPVLCSTFSKELAEERGLLLGNVSLITTAPINWGPCLNLHRSPYYGRMQENCSEDPVLGGYQVSSLANGAWSKGCAVTVKHFAGNSIEINRSGLAQFNTEQAWRELELRSFQVALENGAKGVMTSYSRLGCIWTGGYKNLVTNILKDEWGVHGYVVSDMIHNAQESKYMAIKEAAAAGTTLMDNSTDWLSPSSSNRTWAEFTAENVSKDGDLLETMKRGMKDLLYLLVNSNLMNGKGVSMRKVNLISPWRAAYISAIAVSALLTISMSTLCIVSSLKKKEK